MAFTEIKIKYGGSYTVRFHAEDEGTLKVWEEKRHMRPEYELHMILEGQCCLSCDDGDMELDRGTAGLIASGSYHSKNHRM